MKRTMAPSAPKPSSKRRKLNTDKPKRRKYKTRIIGPMDIKSTKSDYCIEIKEDNLRLSYFPNFYSAQESAQILDELEHSVEYDASEESSVILFGKKYKIPRKQTAYGAAGTSYKFSGNNVFAKEWNTLPLIEEIKKKIEAHLASLDYGDDDEQKKEDRNKYNFCLLNRYKDGNDRMGFHKDDERDLVHG